MYWSDWCGRSLYPQLHYLITQLQPISFRFLTYKLKMHLRVALQWSPPTQSFCNLKFLKIQCLKLLYFCHNVLSKRPHINFQFSVSGETQVIVWGLRWSLLGKKYAQLCKLSWLSTEFSVWNWGQIKEELYFLPKSPQHHEDRTHKWRHWLCCLVAVLSWYGRRLLPICWKPPLKKSSIWRASHFRDMTALWQSAQSITQHIISFIFNS